MSATWEFRMSSAKWELGTHCLGNTSAVRFTRVSLFLDGFNIPLNKGGKEGEAFRGLSWRVQETRADNPQALRDHCRFAPPPLLRGNLFALRRS